MEIGIGVHNDFEIVITDCRTNEIKDKIKGYNIMLNQFWTSWFSGSSNALITQYIHFGSGTSIPLATDTKLTTFIASKASTRVSKDTSTMYSDGIIKTKNTIRINAGEQTGKTISEVGFGYGATQTYLCTKSLLADANGNPIQILVGEFDIIDIYGVIYTKIPLPTDKFWLENGSGLFNFLTFDGSSIRDNAYYYQHKYLFGNAARSPRNYLFGKTGSSPYVSESRDVATKTITVIFPDVIAGNGNIGGYEQITMGSLNFVIPNDTFVQPLIEKEVLGTGDGVTKDFASSFRRLINDGVTKVFVNDIEVPATFDYGITKAYDGNTITYLLKLLQSGTENGQPFYILENQHYQKFGINYSGFIYYRVYVSDNAVDWTWVQDSYGTIAAQYRNKRYFKFLRYNNTWGFQTVESTDLLNHKDVHLSTPPDSGATIALTYNTNCIAKYDQRIIKNVKMKFHFNEYTP